jgi:hypothetical protein
VSAAARIGLAKRYSRWHHFFRERDPESFASLTRWLRGLGYHCPLGTRWPTWWLSLVVGYDHAVRIRTGARKQWNRALASLAAPMVWSTWLVLADWSVLADALV